MKDKSKGFTLIELLVVIAIIGILASVVLASLNSARGKARDASRAAQINQVMKALDVYFLGNGSYPPSGDAAGTHPDCGSTGWCLPHVVDTHLTGLMNSIPPDPTVGGTGNNYRYCGGGVNYIIIRYSEELGRTCLPPHNMDISTNGCGGPTNLWRNFPACP